MNTQTQKFQPDELVTWTSFERGSWTKRQVAVERVTGGGRAIVTFGHTAEGVARRYDVPVSELSRPEPTQNRVPIYHSAAIRPPEPPQPPSEQQLADRLVRAREALTETHENVRRAKDVVRSTGELVRRAQAEHSAATAAVNRLTAGQKTQERRFEAAIRRGETPPAIEPGEDRAAIVQRVDACAAALAKFTTEDQTAQARLSSATAAVRSAATGVVTNMLEREITRLRQMELEARQYRADLLRVTQQMGASGTPLKLTEFASTVLSLPLDPDSVTYLPTAAVAPWEAFLARLLVDPAAGFEQPVTETQSKAA